MKILSFEPCQKKGVKVILTDFFHVGILLISPLYQSKIDSIIFNERKNICKDGCNFLGHNITTNIYSCECSMKIIIMKKRKKRMNQL